MLLRQLVQDDESHHGERGTQPTTGAGALIVGNPASSVTLNEDGSSLLYPFLQELVTPLHTTYSNITLAPAAGGSGKGISDAIAGNVQMGGSDAYLSAADIAKTPGLLNVPVAISSQAVNYNVSNVSNLKLSGDVIAQIYEGKITKWNDPAIASLNPGVTLPAQTIVPVRRVDGSGDTFIFTSFLSDTNSAWQSGPSIGTTVPWPAVSNELTAEGNPGMVQTCHATGLHCLRRHQREASAQAAGLGEAELQNQSGSFVQPDATTVGAAVTAGVGTVPANLAAPHLPARRPVLSDRQLRVPGRQVDTVERSGGRGDPHLPGVRQLADRREHCYLPGQGAVRGVAGLCGVEGRYGAERAGSI